MNESDLLKEEPRLFEQLFSTLYLSIGFEQVKKNKGKPGIDGVSIADFEICLDEELSQLQQELTKRTYQPFLVRRLVKLLQPYLLSVPITENRNPYQATVTVTLGVSTKEKTASLSKTGQPGCTTKASY